MIMEFEQYILNRLRHKDHTLWTDNPQRYDAIINRLGWLDAVEWIQKNVDGITQWSHEVRKARWLQHVLLLGMGGSSLVTQVFAAVFKRQHGYPTITVLDTTSPEKIIEADFNLSHTMIIVSSKSGSTIETSDLCSFFYHRIEKEVQSPGEHFVAITDSGSELEKLAVNLNFGKTFVNPSDIGGRYSALSYFGLVPAALIGINLSALCNRLLTFHEELVEEGMSHLAFRLGRMMGKSCLDSGLNHLQLKISPELEPLSMWIEQLIAESTGKAGKGILPLYHKKLIAKKEPNKLTSTVEMLGKSTRNDTQTEEEHRQITWYIRDIYDLGSEFFRWEVATAVAASYLQINPFDEPNVAEAKAITHRFINDSLSLSAKPFFSGSHYDMLLGACTQVDNTGWKKTYFQRFFDHAEVAQYIAILAYLPEFSAVSEKLHLIKQAIAKTTNTSTTLGFGPRYLHSTGQLHKGGPIDCCFVQIVETMTSDLIIPGRSYTFGELYRAQADGDFSVLDEKLRPIMRLLLKGDRLLALDQLLSDLP